jgi:ankyrin repeat protein
LLLACENNHFEVISVLLTAGANLEAQDKVKTNLMPMIGLMHRI